MIHRLFSARPDRSMLRMLATGGLCVSLAACGSTPPADPMQDPMQDPMTWPDAGMALPGDAGTWTDTGPDPDPDPDPAPFTARARSVTLLRGSEVDLAIEIERAPGFDEVLAIAVEGLPAGVEASAPTEVEGSSAVVRLVAQPGATPGDHALIVRVSSSALEVEARAFAAIPDEAGTMDASFAPTPAGEWWISDLRVLDDGSVVAAWGMSGVRPAVGFGRWRRDGSADPAYGSDGRATIEVAVEVVADSEDVIGAAFRDDGSAVAAVVARMADGSLRTWLVAVDAEGRADESLGPDGTFLVGDDRVTGMALSADRIAVVSAGSVEGGDVARVRTYAAIRPTGAIFDVAIPNVEPRAVAFDAAGRVLIAGRQSTYGALARLTTAGELDTSFHEDGLATFGALGVTGVRDLAVRPSGSIIVVGVAGDAAGTTYHPFAAMVRDDGSLDPSFGALGGRMVVSAVQGTFYDVHVAPDGRMVAVGYDGMGRMMLGHILAGGVLAPELGPSGVLSDPQLGHSVAVGAASDHRVVVGTVFEGEVTLRRFWY